MNLPRPSRWAMLALVGCAALFCGDMAKAQAVAVSVSGSTYQQNFDGITTGSNASIATAAPGWSFFRSGTSSAMPTYASGSNTTAVTQNAGTVGTGAVGSSSSGGAYLWVTGTLASGTDKSIGYLSSGNYPTTGVSSSAPGQQLAILFGFTNTTGSTITTLDLAWNYERYRQGSRTQGWEFYTSTDGSTWSANSLGNTSYSGTGTLTYNPPESTAKAVSIPGLSLANNESYFLRWSYVTTGSWSNAQGLGIDDFAMNLTTSGSGVTTDLYWNGAAGWNATAPGAGGAGTWADGSGSWDSSKTANFAGTANTVIAGTVTAGRGMKFGTTGYTIAGGTVTLSGSLSPLNTITTGTDASVTTTITSALAGSAGLTKAGAGTLVLGGVSTFTGTVSVNAGTLQVAADSALGDSANDISLASSTLKTTASISLASGRDLTGAGTLDIAPSTKLTTNGLVNLTATTLANSGTLDLQGSTRSLGSLVLGSAAVVNGAGPISLTGISAAAVTSGSAIINPGITFATGGDKTVDVGAGGTLALHGDIAGTTGRILKTGAGTLVVNAANSTGGFRIGAAGASPTNGGVVVLGNAASSGTGQLQFNYGTLKTTVPGGITFPSGVSIGGREGAVAVIGGNEPITFSGSSSFFKSFGTSGELRLDVNNTTTISGTLGGATSSGSSTGLTLGGTGRLILAATGVAASGSGSFTERVTVNPGATLQIANASALAASNGLVPLAGGKVTLSAGLQTTVGGLSPNAGGLVDVGNGMVTVAAGLSAADLVAAILSGLGDGSWNGTSGITSSVAAASGGDRTVGWLDNGDGTVTFGFAAAGDTNLDWTVDITDVANFLAGGKFDSGTPASWIEGDFTYDGTVDILDAASFLSSGLFDAGAYNPAPGQAGSIAAVPEPAVGLVGMSTILALGWLVAYRPRRGRSAAVALGAMVVASWVGFAQAQVTVPLGYDEAVGNATVKPSGNRTGANGAAFFNVENSVNGVNASYGVAEWNLGAGSFVNRPDGLTGSDLRGFNVRLTQSNSAFSAATPLRFWLWNNNTPSLASGSTAMTFASTATGGITVPPASGTQSWFQSPYSLWTIGTGSYSVVANGQQDTFTFNTASWDPAARGYVASQLQSGGILRVVFESTQSGTSSGAATYAGYTNSTYSGPELQILVAGTAAPTPTLFWTATPSTLGGSGTWSTAGLTWSPTVTPVTSQAWNPAATAVFAGSAGSVAVSGSVSAAGGLRFDTTGYTLTGGGLALADTAGLSRFQMEVAAGAAATVATPLSGVLTAVEKTGSGSLALTGVNTFVAPLRITQGSLSVASTAALGNTANAVELNGGELALTGSFNLGSRSLTGAAGAAGTGRIAIGSSGRLVTSGPVNLTSLTLPTGGVVELQGSSNLVGDLTVPAGQSARIVGDLNLGQSGRAFDVGTSGTLVIGGVLTNNSGTASGTLRKVGGGTLELTRDNSTTLTRVQLGSGGATPIDGGTLRISNGGAIGSGELFFNVGTLDAAADVVIGGEVFGTPTGGFSLGGRDNAPARITGQNVTVVGNVVRFGPSNTYGDIRLNVDNVTTFAGPVIFATGTGSNFSVTGFKVGGAGRLRLTGDLSQLAAPVSLVDGVTLAVETDPANPTKGVMASGTVLVGGNATLTGNGTVGELRIDAGGRLNPGLGTGVLTTTGSSAFAGSGNYNWQLLNATATAGSGWDLLAVGTNLDIAATSADPFRINLWTLSGTGPDVNGPASNFDSTQDYTWTIATAASGITNFSADKFVIRTSATNGTGGFANAFGGGTFSVAQSGNNLNLVFTHGALPPSVITITVASGTQTQTQAGYPTLSGATPVVKAGAGTLVLTAANTLTGSTTVQGGRLQLANSAALGTSRLVPLAGGTVTLSPALQTTVGGLAPNAGGLVDLGNGMVTVAAGLSATDLVTAIVTGLGDGTWNGASGITSSVAAASGGDRTVGWLDNGDGSLTVAFAAAGDTNLDWQVDILDAANFLSGGKFDSGTPATWNQGDFTYDGFVDILDAASFLSNGLFDAGVYNSAPGQAGTVAAVPEPAVGAAGLLAAVASMLLARRRRSTV